MSKDELTIRELEKLSGYSSRSIHHYISRALLPNASGSGPAARYGRQHLLRLKLIEQAKGAGFKVDQRLQELLGGLSLEEMEQLLADSRAFGEWLTAGDWRADSNRPSAKKVLASRLPSTAAMLRGDSTAAKPPVAREESVEYGSAERWERRRFGDSVEISWRESEADAELQRKVKELLRQAAKLLGS